LPVSSRTVEEISARAGYFTHMLDIQAGAPAFEEIQIEYHPRIPIILTEAYFALTDAYKRVHLSEGRRTEPIKQAALTCATIAVIKPLRPIGSPEIDREEYLYINPMLAMRAACSIVEHPFDRRAFDDRRRFYRSLSLASLPSLDPLIDEANENDGVLSSDWHFVLTQHELRDLNHLISMFAVLADLKIYAADDPSADG